MRGITTSAYRRAFVAHFAGLDAAMAPFVPTVSAERINPKLLRDLLPSASPPQLPLIPQLLGKNADDFVRMTNSLEQLGYREVNWNLGCPHKPVRKKTRGAGLLPRPDLVDALLDQICDRSPLRISVKVRLGVASSAELEHLVPVLNQYPLSEVVIHPRTADQMYAGTVDLDAFAAIYPEIRHPVRYNGDIDSPDFFRRLLLRFPELDRFMLGRGLLANPFLCEILRNLPPPAENPIERIAAFHADLLERYEARRVGDRAVLGKMKEFWTYQARHLSNGRKLFKKIKKTTTLFSYRSILDELLPVAQWTPDDPSRSAS